METWTDVGHIARGFADVLIAMQQFLRIQTPLPVRQHMAVFGQPYTDVEPADPIERSRWSDRCFCLRIFEADFSSDDGQIEGRIMKMTTIQKCEVLDETRQAFSVPCVGR